MIIHWHLILTKYRKKNYREKLVNLEKKLDEKKSLGSSILFFKEII